MLAKTKEEIQNKAIELVKDALEYDLWEVSYTGDYDIDEVANGITWYSFELTIDTKEFHTDDGPYKLSRPMILEMNYDEEEYCFIIGEDLEQAITTGNLYQYLFFNSTAFKPHPKVNLEEGLVLDELPDDYKEILEKESHANHKVVSVDGVLRWEEDPKVRDLVDRVGLNDLVLFMLVLGYDKNSEFYRNLYRSIGYSLSGYWEIFYWEVNNPEANEYISNVK